MSCKYCKKGSHLIDNCPEIICKKCRIVGHPFWKCKNKNLNPSPPPNFSKERTTPASVHPKPVEPLDFKKEPPLNGGIFNRNVKESTVAPKTTETYADALCNSDNKIAYYMKYQGVRWSLMI